MSEITEKEIIKKLLDTKYTSMNDGLRLHRIIINTDWAKILYNGYKERIANVEEFEYYIKNGFTVAGIKVDVQDFDCNYNFVKGYIPEYE